MGACATSCAVWVEAMKVTYKGKAIMATPSISTRWVTISRIGRRSIMVGSTCWQASADASVIHLAVDVAELHHSEQYDDGHKYDRLGGRRTDVQRSEEHTSELQSLMRISYAVFCLKKKNTHTNKDLKILK